MTTGKAAEKVVCSAAGDPRFASLGEFWARVRFSGKPGTRQAPPARIDDLRIEAEVLPREEASVTLRPSPTDAGRLFIKTISRPRSTDSRPPEPTRTSWNGRREPSPCGSGLVDRKPSLVWKVRAERPLADIVVRPYKAELHQASKLYELLPQGPNELWQTDVTYIHIPGHGWWYAVTVIDYYSRYLLACHLTSSYCAAEAIHALGLARAEAERLCGPLAKIPFW